MGWAQTTAEQAKQTAMQARAAAAAYEQAFASKVPEIAPALSAAPQLGGGVGLGNVTAALARAGTIGPVSVPTSWAAPSNTALSALSGGGLPTLAETGGLAGAGSAMPDLPGMPAGAVSRPTTVTPRYGHRITVMTRPPAAG